MHSSFHFLFGKLETDLKEIQPKVKTFFWSLFFFCAGWSVIEPYFSIYLQNTVESYTLIGIIQGSMFLVSLLVAVPIGNLADKINPIKSLQQLRGLYTPIAILFFLAGALLNAVGLVFILIAQVIRGFGTSERIFVEVYLRKHSQPKHTASLFGLLFTTQYFSRIVGILIAIMIMLVWGATEKTLYWFFVLVIPFTWISIAILNRIPAPETEDLKTGFKKIKTQEIKNELTAFNNLGYAGSLITLGIFFFVLVHLLIWIYFPLYALKLNFELIEIGVFFIGISLAYSTSFAFAELADIIGKKRSAVLCFIFASALLFAISVLTQGGTLFFATGLLLGLVVAWAGPSLYGIISDLTPQGHEGEFTGVTNSIVKISELISVVFIGVLLDLVGFTKTFQGIAIALAVFAVLFWISRKSFQEKSQI